MECLNDALDAVFEELEARGRPADCCWHQLLCACRHVTRPGNARMQWQFPSLCAGCAAPARSQSPDDAPPRAPTQLLPAVLGTLTVRATVSGADGRVSGVEFLADTLVVRPGQLITDDEGDPLPDSAARAAVQHCIKDGLEAAEFPACEVGDTFITYPFVFE